LSEESIDKNDSYYQKRDRLPIDRKKRGDMTIDKLQKPLRVKGIKILYPTYVSTRIAAQSSIFTIQDDPWTPLEEYENRKAEKYIDIEKIIKWEIPKDARFKIVNQLERLDIDNRTLFPELDGLAKGLWQREVISKVTNRVK
jgi:hypothetical protein